MTHYLLLFLSSYIPLYALLIGKSVISICIGIDTFSIMSGVAIASLMVILAVSGCYLIWVIKHTDAKAVTYEVKTIDDRTGDMFFGYISVYLLSCLGLSLNNIIDNYILLFLMILIGFIYVSNKLVYMNPMLQLFRYRTFRGKLVAIDFNGRLVSNIIIVPKNIDLGVGDQIEASFSGDLIIVSKKLGELSEE